MKHTLLKTIFSISLLVAANSISAFGGLSLPGLGGGDSGGADVGDLLNQQGTMMKNAVGAYKSLTEAQAFFAEALGLKDDLAYLHSEAEQLGSGKFSDEDALEKYTSISEKTQEAIDEKIASGATLTEESKVIFQKGMSPYSKGVVQIIGVATGIPDWLKGAKSAGVAGISKLASGLSALPKVASAAQKFIITTETMISFADTQNIDTAELKADTSNISL